jgi:truncated hemoglobin YjbI/quinol monooxygenase YgiN
MMIVEYIRYQIPSETAAQFEADYARAAEQLAAAPECADYELSRCDEEPESYVLRITWTSKEDHLGGFRGGEHFPPFLAAIRPYVANITEMRHYTKTAVAGQGGSVPTLYDWLGGGEALDRLTEAFYSEVVKDELLYPLFKDMDSHHPHFVALWLGEVFGGPRAYSSERGDYRHMVGRHLGKHITEQQRRRWVSLLMDAADEVGLPDDPEFRAAFVSYIEWGTRSGCPRTRPSAPRSPRTSSGGPGWRSSTRNRAARRTTRRSRSGAGA